MDVLRNSCVVQGTFWLRNDFLKQTFIEKLKYLSRRKKKMLMLAIYTDNAPHVHYAQFKTSKLYLPIP